MTFDQVCQIMATRSSKTPEQWSDFFSMEPQLQDIEAELFANAIFEKSGTSGFQEILSLLATAVSVVGMAAGVGSAYSIFKAL